LSDKYACGFHNTATAGILGAVAAIARLRNLPVLTVKMAFGIAGSKAAGSMPYLNIGCWSKRLHPGFAVYDAFPGAAVRCGHNLRVHIWILACIYSKREHRACGTCRKL
jgi:2-methylcitrate dehydratase PrpD